MRLVTSLPAPAACLRSRCEWPGAPRLLPAGGTGAGPRAPAPWVNGGRRGLQDPAGKGGWKSFTSGFLLTFSLIRDHLTAGPCCSREHHTSWALIADAQDFQAHAENSTAFSDELERYIRNQKVQSYLTDDLQYKEVKKTSVHACTILQLPLTVSEMGQGGNPTRVMLQPEEMDVKRDQKNRKAGTQTVYMFRRCTVATFIILTLVIIFALAAALAVKKDKLPSTSHQVSYLLIPAASCPDGWIGYRRKCYYFSEDEGNWTLSQSMCSSYNSSLTVINSQEDMNFVMRYKGTLDHWIGLGRKPGQPWKWTDGTDFNNWFEVKGNSLCAYLNEFAVSSSGCYTERNWICSRPDEYTQRQQKDSEVMVT